MIIKANKQIGFIYKNNESIDKILKDGDVVFERGFLREKTSTALPITFGGVGKNLKDYKIYGNTYQNSTTGKNLLGFGATNSGKGTQTTYDEKTGLMTTVGTTTGNYPWANEFDVNIPSGTSLTISSNSQYQIIARLYYDSSNYEEINSTTGSSKTLTHDIIKIALLINIRTNITINETYYVQIEKGTTATEFEPYTGGQPSPNPDYPQEIVSCGDLITDSQDENYGKYKIPVNVRSDNLLNNTFQTTTVNGVTATKNIDGSITVNGTATTGNATFNVGSFIQKQNIQYTLNGCPAGGGSSTYRLYPMGTGSSYYDNGEGVNFPTVNADVERTIRIIIYKDTTVENLTFYPMIRLTETQNAKYQPYYNQTTNIYLDEPLKKIDGYSDYIDFINSKVIRNIGEIIFDGTESRWAYYTDTNKPVFYMGFQNADWFYNKTDIWACYCNYYKGKNNVSSFDNVYNYGNNSIAFRTQYPRLVIRDDSKTSLDDFKTWVQTHNLIVDYVLATSTEESITSPNIPTIDGNNTLNIETEITPSQVYIKYKSNT